MEQPTHYLNVTVGIDFTKIFSPEYIKGVRLMIGASSDEEVINVLANNIIIDMQKSIEAKSDYVSIMNADLHSLSELALSQKDAVSEQAEELPDVGGDSNEWYEEQSSTVESELENEELMYDSYSQKLLESIGDDIFSIESHLGTEINLYLNEYEKYGQTVANELGSELPILPLEDLGNEAEELQAEDYVIRYKDISGEIKYGKRNFKKNINLEENK